MHHHTKFHGYQSGRCRDMVNYRIFAKWRPPAILDSPDAHWDHPQRVLGIPYRCAKFGLNPCSSFDNMKILIFCTFGLKMPSRLQNGGFGGGV